MTEKTDIRDSDEKVVEKQVQRYIKTLWDQEKNTIHFTRRKRLQYSKRFHWNVCMEYRQSASG